MLGVELNTYFLLFSLIEEHTVLPFFTSGQQRKFLIHHVAEHLRSAPWGQDERWRREEQSRRPEPREIFRAQELHI